MKNQTSLFEKTPPKLRVPHGAFFKATSNGTLTIHEQNNPTRWNYIHSFADRDGAIGGSFRDKPPLRMSKVVPTELALKLLAHVGYVVELESSISVYQKMAREIVAISKRPFVRIEGGTLTILRIDNINVKILTAYGNPAYPLLDPCIVDSVLWWERVLQITSTDRVDIWYSLGQLLADPTRGNFVLKK